MAIPLSNHAALNRMACTVTTIDGEMYTKVTSSPVTYTDYESKSLQIGTSFDGYDVKVTGSMFGTVTTSAQSIIKNRAGNTGTITAYLVTDGANPIVLSPGESIIVDNLALTNIFLDSDASFGAAEFVDIVLFG